MTYPRLKIIFLGTGTSTGVPMIGCDCEVCTSADKKDKRLRSSILVQSASTTLIVDTGPDFRYQMLRENIHKLDAALITHPHKDHIAGLDDIRAFNFFNKKQMPVYANSLTEEAIRRDFYYAFSDTKYPGIPEIELHTISLTPFTVGDIPVTPVMTWHLKMPVMGFRFGKFTYITDANRIEDKEKEKIMGTEVLVLNALRKKEHVSHFNLKQAIDLSQELNPRETYFTHVSHQMGKHAEVESELPDSIHLAYDRMVLEL
ncbi:MAG: MBL fold metallo-hydrolase [Chitinophagaceae bacterium]|nr:MBL fold metallo-hydrolase [Chitinophagaceae bacterium]